MQDFTYQAYQHIGGRKTQEDTFIMAPELDHGGGGSRRSAFFGIFDGTVGDFASTTVSEIIVNMLKETPSWQRLSGDVSPDKVAEALIECYYRTDHELLHRCAAKGNEHYATCTSVTVAIVDDVVQIAHTGDARMIVGKVNDDGSPAEAVAVTIDHTPDLPEEKARIEKNGGEVVRLQKHSNKPYIRGGDFMMRKALGEQPMQLQYGRAFGCKDLKIFGLTCEPEITTISARGLEWLILGSDGIWGVVSPKNARDIAKQAVEAKINPAQAVVHLAMSMCKDRNIRADNLSVVCIQFHR